MKIETKYNIGDKVFAGRSVSTKYTEDCPTCGGSAVLHTQKANGSKLTLDCPDCKNGDYYSKSSGKITKHKWKSQIERLTIGQIRVKVDSEEQSTEYMCEETGVGSGTIWPEEVLWLDREKLKLFVDKRTKELNNTKTDSDYEWDSYIR